MKTDKYREAISQIQEMVDANPSLTRKDRHDIICKLTGIEKGTQEVVERYSRALRHVLPKDQRSSELEAEWHNTPQIAKSDAELDALFMWHGIDR